MQTLNIPEIEISIKYKSAIKKSQLFHVSNSKDIADLCRSLYDADTVEWFESMILVCLNRANKVIGWYKVSQGGITGTICDPKVVFTIALNCVGTCYIIITHNHPSGNLNPSDADDKLTQKIEAAGKLLDIKLLDHIIIADDSYYSYSDEGKL